MLMFMNVDVDQAWSRGLCTRSCKTVTRDHARTAFRSPGTRGLKPASCQDSHLSRTCLARSRLAAACRPGYRFPAPASSAELRCDSKLVCQKRHLRITPTDIAGERWMTTRDRFTTGSKCCAEKLCGYGGNVHTTSSFVAACQLSWCRQPAD